MPACGSPRLIAACHVLHRLLLPRHPPCALSSLTTKFTQHTRVRSQLSAFGFQLKTFPNTPCRFHGPLNLLLARLLPHQPFQSCHLKDSLETLKLETLKLPLRTPAGISGTHKKLRSPCRLPNLFSCQISSSLTFASCPPWRVWVLLTSECANSLVPPTQCSAPSDFL